MEMVNGMLAWMMAKVDQVFAFFGLYTTQYSKWIVYGVILFIASKIFKIKLNLNTGGKK